MKFLRFKNLRKKINFFIEVGDRVLYTPTFNGDPLEEYVIVEVRPDTRVRREGSFKLYGQNNSWEKRYLLTTQDLQKHIDRGGLKLIKTTEYA